MELKNCIIARLKNDDKERYWLLPDELLTSPDHAKHVIGKYVIVQNMNGYDLVYVEGIAILPSKYRRGHKKVLQILDLPKLDNGLPF